MAKNRVYAVGDHLPLTCTYPTTPASGDPILCGQIPGVALSAEDTNGVTSVATTGVFNLSVKGADSDGSAAIAAGDILYFNHSATPVLNSDDGGVRFGYAMAAVGSGSTATIAVKLGY